jgi:hypothetical protein
MIAKTETNGHCVRYFDSGDNIIRDLAWDGTYILAINTGGEIKQFDTLGALVDSIVGLLNGGWGLTYGDDYLWASDPDEDMIYQIGFGSANPPTMEAILEPQGQYYNSTPSFANFGFDDDVDLDDGWYQIDSYTGTWTPLFTDIEGSEWNDDGWILPGFDALGEGSHTIYFKASDDFGNIEGESGEWSWQFYKDVTPPGIFSLIEPADYTWVKVTTPTFIWHAAMDQLSGLSKYKIYVDEILRDSSADTLWVANFDIYEGYHDWHVIAYDDAGNYRESEQTPTFGVDTTAPMFSETVIWSDTGFQGPYSVTTNVSETTSEIDSVLLYYKFANGEWQCSSMDVVYGLKYGAEIPKAPKFNIAIRYYLKAKDLANNIALEPKAAPDSVYSFVGWVGIAERNVDALPAIFAISQNYPNPFRHSTVVKYSIPDFRSLIPEQASIEHPASRIQLKIYDLTGRLVRTLVDEIQQPGYYKVSWDGLDESGRRVKNGVYVCRIAISSVRKMGYQVETKKMILLGY